MPVDPTDAELDPPTRDTARPGAARAPDEGRREPPRGLGDDPARARRLLRLRVLLKSMVATAVAVVAFVCLSVFLSDDGEEDTLPGRRFAIGDMRPGETRTLVWDGRAVLVHRRTPAQIRHLEDADGTLASRLRDPSSARSEQPAGMDGALRSSDPEWFVAIGLGTDYGCPVGWLAPEAAPFAGLPWPGGFVDGCRGSRYDLAGRVYAGQYADRNLVVPPHAIEDGALRLGG